MMFSDRFKAMGHDGKSGRKVGLQVGVGGAGGSHRSMTKAGAADSPADRVLGALSPTSLGKQLGLKSYTKEKAKRAAPTFKASGTQV